jgi:hypothetical protein
MKGRLTDLRSIGSRVWIALVTFALVGIVAMQLWMVKLNVGIGRALEHEALLQRENSTLSIGDSMQSSGERIEQLAAARGMTIAPPGALRFEQARGALDVRLAAAALARPVQTRMLGASGIAAGSTGAPVGSEASSGEAATGQAPGQSAGTVAATSAPAPAPSATAQATSTPATAATQPTAQAPATPAASGAAEAGSAAPTAGAVPAGPGGGTQAAPGG